MIRNRKIDRNRFLSFFPDLSKTPSLNIICPSGIEEVAKYFESEDYKTNKSDHIVSLHVLCNFVDTNRVDLLQRNLSGCIEYEHLENTHKGNIVDVKPEVLAPESHSSDEHGCVAIINKDNKRELPRDSNPTAMVTPRPL